jgi:hypothetical protein
MSVVEIPCMTSAFGVLYFTTFRVSFVRFVPESRLSRAAV